MIFSNPFLVIQLIFMFSALGWAYYMDGADMPERKYNFMQTFWSVAINFTLIMLAINWAVNH